jgi:hypothetical protein
MPTFFNPGGRTLAGGDMMPWVMLWPRAGRVMTTRTNPVARIRFELLVISGTAYPSESTTAIYICNPGGQTFMQ